MQGFATVMVGTIIDVSTCFTGNCGSGSPVDPARNNAGVALSLYIHVMPRVVLS